MARKKKVKVKTGHHQKRVLAIAPIIVAALLYTITGGSFSEGDIFIDILAGVFLGCLIGGGLAYYNTKDDGILEIEEKQESITTGVLVFSGTVTLLLISTAAPTLISIWKNSEVKETFRTIFEAKNFEKIMWNVLYLVIGYTATVIILMKSVPAIAQKFGELEEDALADKEKEEEDPAATATGGAGGAGAGGGAGGAAGATATTAPGAAATTTTASPKSSSKTKDGSGKFAMWVGVAVLTVVIISAILNSGTPSKKNDGKKDDSVSKTDDRPKHEHAEKKKSELDEDFANTLRRNGEQDPENLSVNLTEEEAASEEGERFGE